MIGDRRRRIASLLDSFGNRPPDRRPILIWRKARVGSALRGPVSLVAREAWRTIASQYPENIRPRPELVCEVFAIAERRLEIVSPEQAWTRTPRSGEFVSPRRQQSHV